MDRQVSRFLSDHAASRHLLGAALLAGLLARFAYERSYAR
jgi:hypothetical protein